MPGKSAKTPAMMMKEAQMHMAKGKKMMMTAKEMQKRMKAHK